MAAVARLALNSRSPVSRLFSTTVATRKERFGQAGGESGWKWEKGGVGMGGKNEGKATEIKPDVGKEKTYKVPEYFAYNDMSYYDVEASMTKQRVPQPKSGMTDYW